MTNMICVDWNNAQSIEEQYDQQMAEEIVSYYQFCPEQKLYVTAYVTMVNYPVFFGNREFDSAYNYYESTNYYLFKAVYRVHEGRATKIVSQTQKLDLNLVSYWINKLYFTLLESGSKVYKHYGDLAVEAYTDYMSRPEVSDFQTGLCEAILDLFTKVDCTEVDSEKTHYSGILNQLITYLDEAFPDFGLQRKTFDHLLKLVRTGSL